MEMLSCLMTTSTCFPPLAQGPLSNGPTKPQPCSHFLIGNLPFYKVRMQSKKHHEHWLYSMIGSYMLIKRGLSTFSTFDYEGVVYLGKAIVFVLHALPSFDLKLHKTWSKQ